MHVLREDHLSVFLALFLKSTAHVAYGFALYKIKLDYVAFFFFLIHPRQLKIEQNLHAIPVCSGEGRLFTSM
jgi:hypothetical protein